MMEEAPRSQMGLNDGGWTQTRVLREQDGTTQAQVLGVYLPGVISGLVWNIASREPENSYSAERRVLPQV